VTVRIVIREIKNRQSVQASTEKIKKIFPQTEKKTHKKLIEILYNSRKNIIFAVEMKKILG